MDDDEYDDDEGSERVGSALRTALVAIVLIGVVIALGTVIVVRALGLDEGGSSDPVGSDSPAETTKPLPTTALPNPDEEETEAEPDDQITPKSGKGGRLQLSASPVMARPNERINLTGTYRKADNIGLQVQRFEDGKWRDFGVDATVRVGTYETYVMTGQSGEQRFRMFDPATKRGSNVVLVTVD
jgi:hypothetical protein